jgi:HEXXH motif-containing protein
VQHPELALLEAILHEYNHNKLNLIMQTERLVLNDLTEAYYSPYRPDARHILGIYLGIHAIA